MDDIVVIENFFPLVVYREILNKVHSSETRWFFKDKNLSHPIDYEIYKAQLQDVKIFENVKGFQSELYNDNMTDSDNRIKNVFTSYIEKQFNITVNHILRINCNFIIPCSNFPSNSYMLPHTDVNIPHKTLIYYINDCDGETVFFNRILDKEINYSGLTVEKKITPSKNKAVLFNGLRLHSSSPSQTFLRKIINVNFT